MDPMLTEGEDKLVESCGDGMEFKEVNLSTAALKCSEGDCVWLMKGMLYILVGVCWERKAALCVRV